MRTVILVLVMVCLSDGKARVCSVEKMKTVSSLSKTLVSCPSTVVNSTDQKYLLLFNNICINQIYLTKSDNTKGSFFGQFEVTTYSSGVYVCQREVIYPPPFRKDCHITEVIVADHNNQSLPAVNATDNPSCADRSPVIPDMVMWMVSVFLLVYSLSITCCIIVIWRKLKGDKEEMNLYANMRRWEHRKPCK